MADAGPVVRVTVTPDLDGYTRLCAAVNRRRVGWLLYLGGGLILIGLYVTVVNSRNGPVRLQAALPVLVFGLVFLMLPLSVRWQVRRNWERSPELRAERVYEIAADGIGHASAVSAGRADWSVIQRAGVVAGSVVMFTGQGQVFYVPESALTDGQRADLDDLLRAHVPGFGGLPPRT